jgi:hypothetical protein
MQFPNFTLNTVWQPRCLIGLLSVLQLVYAVPGQLLPVLALSSRLSNVESSCPIEVTTEESESESESAKFEEFCAARRCSVPRMFRFGKVRGHSIFTRCSRFGRRSFVESAHQNGFRARRLC